MGYFGGSLKEAFCFFLGTVLFGKTKILIGEVGVKYSQSRCKYPRAHLTSLPIIISPIKYFSRQTLLLAYSMDHYSYTAHNTTILK